jgi:hypothetical protein
MWGGGLLGVWALTVAQMGRRWLCSLFWLLSIIVAMWGVSCPLQEGIGIKKRGKKMGKKCIPVGEANADKKGC